MAVELRVERARAPAVRVRVVRKAEGLELELSLIAHRAHHLELGGVVGGQSLRDGAVRERGPLVGPLLLRHALEAHRLRVIQRVLAEDVQHHPRDKIQLLVIAAFVRVETYVRSWAASGGDARGGSAARGRDGADRGGRGGEDRHGWREPG